MVFKSFEEREEYATKVSCLTPIGFAFCIIGSELEENPNGRYTSQYRDWRDVRCFINDLIVAGVISCNTEDCFVLKLTDKGRKLLPRYKKANDVFVKIMNDL